LARVARQEGWDVLRFDRLGGRVKMLCGLAAATLLGAAGRTAATRRSGTPLDRRLAASRRLRRRYSRR
jgi:hypothetical protein